MPVSSAGRKSRGLPGCQGRPDPEREVGLAHAWKFHLPALLCMETAACCPLHTLGLRVRWLGAWG